MSFVLILCLSLMTLVGVETQTSRIYREQSLARSNALLGLQMALGDLQKSAGPDQRVSGTADLVTGLSVDSHRHWTGIWDVSSQDAFSAFIAPSEVSWLVSGTDTSGNVLTPGATVKDPVTLFEDVTNPENEVVVGLEAIQSASNSKGSYAYWVSDEGVKAKLKLSDPHRDTSGQVTSGYNFSQMTGQRVGIEQIRLSENGSDTIGDFMDPLESSNIGDVERMVTLDQLSLLDDNLNSLPVDRLHELTTRSYGVLADVARGGLKKDLSLGFEMDLSDFNADTNFAAGGESLAPGPKGTIGGHEIRYLFTHDYTKDDRGIRGPTWHMLRNYYRLYLQDDPDRLVDYKTEHPNGVVDQGSSGYAIRARPFFPQVPDGSQPFGMYHIGEALYDVGLDINTANMYELSGDRRVPRPTDMQINPVVTRMQLFLSLQAVKVFIDDTDHSLGHNYRIDLIASPVVTIWNPYNVALSFDEFKVSWRFLALPIEVQYREPGGSLETFRISLSTLHGAGFTNVTINNELQSTTLEPGQVKVFSHVTSVSDTDYFDIYAMTAKLEPFTGSVESELNSFRFDQIKIDSSDNVSELLVKPGTELRFHGQSGGGQYGNYWDRLAIQTSLKWGGEFLNTNLGDLRKPSGVRNFYWPEEDSTYFGYVEDIEEYNAFGEGPLKHPLGLVDTYLKPEGAVDMSHPVQFLARYNPRAISMTRITGGFEGGYDFPLAGNWNYSIKPFQDWSSSFVPVDATNGNGYWGWDNMNGAQHVVLFELPTAPLQSLASFQHVNNISRYAQEPAYVIGNSYASPFIARDQVTEVQTRTQVDWSYLSNEALWDTYFFSSLSPREDLNEDFETVLNRTLIGDPLPDSRMKFYNDSNSALRSDLLDADTSSKIDAEAYAKSAMHLMVDGAFNVNSTSIEAWKAILSSANKIDVGYMNNNTRNSAVSQDSPFGRMSLPSGDSTAEWLGFRSLSDSQISDLAEKIVDQVKLRGPFVSLADFVNRRLSTDETGLMGPLQAAIDATSGLNSQFADVVSGSDISASNIPYPEQATGATASAATGYLLQSDLLMSLGPVLSARSDTFTIRAYGDHEDLVTGQKAIAICEAVVQRIPVYVDPSDDANLLPESVNADNENFGRRFVVCSIRWLDLD